MFDIFSPRFDQDRRQYQRKITHSKWGKFKMKSVIVNIGGIGDAIDNHPTVRTNKLFGMNLSRETTEIPSDTG